MIEQLIVRPGEPPRLDERDPAGRLGVDSKAEGREELARLNGQLSLLQRRLYAEGRNSVLLVLQGLDASGKDGVIRSVFTGINPQGVRVVSFKAPGPNELAHDYLWRIHLQLPRRGEIGIFNRSHYEDVVTVRVLELAPESVRVRRPAHIREFEKMLTEEGTALVKVFLHVSKEEQRTRLQERLDDPEKRWKWEHADLETRKQFDEVMAAYEEVIEQTSTTWAPWFVVPADRNWVKSLAVATLLVDTLERIDPRLPAPPEGLDGLVVI